MSRELSVEEKTMLRDVFRRLDSGPLSPGDELYEPIYEKLETEDPIAKLKTQIEWASAESLQLFSGFRGTGKTTELLRLKRQLEDDGYLVLYANALNFLSPSHEIDITTMMLGVAGAFGEALEHEGGLPALEESFWTRITNYVKKTTIHVEEATAGSKVSTPAGELFGEVEAGIDIKMAIKTTPSFRRRLHEFMNERLYELHKEVADFVEDCVKITRKDNPDRKIVFIFDQFEQIRGSRTTETAVIKSVEQLFAHHIQRLKLPYVHTIYTVPPWLQFVLPGEFSIQKTPCIRLWNNDSKRTPCSTGYELMMEVILRRFGKESFEKIFGEGSDGREQVNPLIEVCGGHFRDLLSLLRETLVLVNTWRPKLPVTKEVIDRAVSNTRKHYLPISEEDAKWLHQIGSSRECALPDDSSVNINRLTRFLDTHLALYFTNGSDWYDVHPLIRDEVEKLSKQVKS